MHRMEINMEKMHVKAVILMLLCCALSAALAAGIKNIKDKEKKADIKTAPVFYIDPGNSMDYINGIYGGGDRINDRTR